MDKRELITKYWNDVASQNADNLRNYFTKDVIINWHNTNESFNLEEFIIANCEYPGSWIGTVERVEVFEDLVITVARVSDANNNESFHVVAFFRFKDDKIIQIDEFWGDDGSPPKWRLEMEIGKPIK